MPTAAFTTLGCKVNQYETQKILESFEARGFEVVPFDSPADVYVVNTCSVTSDAESKSHYVVRRARRTNPLAKVVVTGCAGQMSANKGTEFEGADLLVPNPSKLQTLAATLDEFPEFRSVEVSTRAPHIGGRSRATLKVQDGCSVMCSYCSIPYTRPGMVSRPWREVLEEAQQLHRMGYQEACLTGVLIGSYGPESGSEGPDFESLVELLARESGLARIRISSIEVHQVTDRLIELLGSGLVVPHLHVPLQSGDDGVLADMNRRYRRDDFLNLVAKLRSKVKNFTLTSDVMVGFPTETRERFELTLDIVERTEMLKAHVFRFSPRHGTPADAWGDPVSPDEKKARATELARLAANVGRRAAEKFVGSTHRVVFESSPNRQGLLEGTTDNWLHVEVPGPASLCRTLGWVRLDSFDGESFGGEVVAGAPALALAPL